MSREDRWLGDSDRVRTTQKGEKDVRVDCPEVERKKATLKLSYCKTISTFLSIPFVSHLTFSIPFLLLSVNGILRPFLLGLSPSVCSSLHLHTSIFPYVHTPLFIDALLSFSTYILFSSNTYMLLSFTKYVLIFCSIVFIPLPSMLFRNIGSSPVYRDSRVSDLRTAFNNPSGPGGTARKRALMAAGAQGNNSNRDRGDNTQTTSSS